MVSAARRLLPWLLAFGLAACGDDAPPGPALPPSAWLPADVPPETAARAAAAFNRGVGLMDRYEAKEAIAAFEEALRLAPRWTAARFNLGIACLNAEMPDLYGKAEAELAAVAAATPDDPRPHFALAMLFQHLGRYVEAEARFRRVLELDPEDPDADYRLGLLLAERDPAAARRHLERTVARIPHHEAATYHLFTLLRDAGDAEAAEALLARFQALKEAGAGLPSGMKYGEMGRYADAVRPFARPSGAEAASRPEVFAPPEDAAARWGLGGVAGGPGVAAADVDMDGDLDLVVAGTGALLRAEGGTWRPDPSAGIDAAKATSAWFGDADADGDPDLYLAGPEGDRFLRNARGTFLDATGEAGLGGSAGGVCATWFDADHDGDLDLFVGRAGPDRLWRNDGSGRFTDVAGAAGLAGGDARTVAAVPFDLDDDTDLDLLVVHDGARSRLLRNDRVGAWTDVTAAWPALALEGRAAGAAVGDADGDGREDLLLVRGDAPPRLVLQTRRGHYADDPAFAASVAGLGGASAAALADLDADGDLDVVLLDAGASGACRHRVLVNRGGGAFAPPADLGAARPARVPTGLLGADLRGDGSLALLVARAGTPLEAWHATVPEGRHWLEVGLDPTKAIEEGKAVPDAVGLSVEGKVGRRIVLARTRSTSGFLGSPPPVARLGLGGERKADYVRLVWPDGMLQSEMEVAADQRWRVPKVERKPSSCPILFSWDGERFVCVTDFLGVGGVGFFVKPGEYAPPDPTEDVRIPPEQVAPKDGRYLLRVAEPLEEVTWLDQLRLLAYDHPAGTEAYPDERFTGSPPWPTGRPHVVGRKVLPVAARDERGRDVLDRVRAVDRRFVDVPHDPRFVGYAADHWLELDFGDRVRALPADAKLVLFLHGWVEYTYSHVNYAASQAGLAMRSPWIEVPDGEGGWREAMAECGFPAGLPRMMTVEVSGLPLRADGRLRIRTNMQVYWDQAFLGEDVAAAGLEAREVPTLAAVLRPLGYPREFSPDGRDPTTYDYRRIDPGLPFRAMEGDYTRFGDVSELLAEVDERLVVMGRGEEIALEFDARALPPPRAGWTRTLVLHADGWCKDMNLYTAFPDTVGPTPWHGMENYPPDAPAPDTEALREYRRTWNTRRVVRR